MKACTVDSELAQNLKEIFGELILEISDYRGDLTLFIDKKNILYLCKILREHTLLAFEQMIDLTAVDYLQQKRVPRFQMVYHFLSLSQGHRLRVKCDVEEADAVVPSISSLWQAVNWYERECFDMYGIRFENHPDLRRILMYDQFEGHPLRKDYFIGKEQPLVELKEVQERHQYMNDYSLLP